MCRTWVGPFASPLHNGRDMIILQKCGAAIDGTKGSYRFPGQKLKEVSVIDAAHGRCYWVQYGVLSVLEFPDAKISRALIESKTDVDGDDSALKIQAVQCWEGYKLMLRCIEDKVGSDESNRLTSPGSGIESSWNSVEPLAGFQSSLCVFCNS
jgi:hypothetical protein